MIAVEESEKLEQTPDEMGRNNTTGKNDNQSVRQCKMDAVIQMLAQYYYISRPFVESAHGL